MNHTDLAGSTLDFQHDEQYFCGCIVCLNKIMYMYLHLCCPHHPDISHWMNKVIESWCSLVRASSSLVILWTAEWDRCYTHTFMHACTRLQKLDLFAVFKTCICKLYSYPVEIISFNTSHILSLSLSQNTHHKIVSYRHTWTYKKCQLHPVDHHILVFKVSSFLPERKTTTKINKFIPS